MAELKKRKKEGFEGQKAIVIPRKILEQQCENSALNSPLYITDIGYYPKARFHHRYRPEGAGQHILIHCTDGKGLVTIDKTEYTAEPGSFIILPENRFHEYRASDENPWTIYWIHFMGSASGGIVDQIIKQLDGHKGFVHYSEERIDLFGKMYNQLEKGYSIDNMAHSAMCLWYYISTFIFADMNNKAGKIVSQPVIEKSIEFMGNKIEQVVTLSEIANSVNLSPSHFSLLFRKKTGFSPIEYFNQMKVQKASQYLLFSDLRIKEIAFKLGIDDPYYFSRLFTKIMGISPNEYRERKNQ